jgi:hypothetical protein
MLDVSWPLVIRYSGRMAHKRSRTVRQRSGNRIALTARDIEIFRILENYRYLRSTYIHAFVGGASATRFKERLGDLFHEGYIDRPGQQWEYADARYRPAVYEAGKGSKLALRAHETDLVNQGSSSNWAGRQFLHTLMCCEVMASLELAIRSQSHLRFIAWPEIQAHAADKAQAALPPFRLAMPTGGYLVPDGVFGIEYQTDGAKTYRFFAIEADRGTMPITRSKPGQTSYLGKLAAYSEIVERQVYKTSWGIPNLLVLTVTNSHERLSGMVGKLGNGAGGQGFLFKSLDGCALNRPVPNLLSDPWMRAGWPSLCIGESR